MNAQHLDDRLGPRDDGERPLGAHELQRVAQLQGVVFAFYAIDGLILAIYALLGALPGLAGVAYILVGWTGSVLAVAAFRRSRRRVADLETNNVLMSGCAMAVMLVTASRLPAVGAPLLMTLMTVLGGAALQLSMARLLGVFLACVLGTAAVLLTGETPLSLPLATAGERALTFAWFVWVLAKCTLVNVEGTRLRRLVAETNARLVGALAEVERLAKTDELTVIGNRRSIVSDLDAALHAGRHRAEPVAIALFDIDHFKCVNDSFGHPTGDAVLREFAALVSRNLRPRDRVGRYGGEEFLLVLEAVDTAEAARDTAERMRRAVEGNDWQALAPGLAVTASAGVATVEAGGSPADAIARADRALYRAKAEGRNRVVVG